MIQKPKRSKTHESTLIALEMLRRIPQGRYITVTDLHKQLEDAGYLRTRRSIERQLESLIESFGIIQDTRTKPYGYMWPKHKRGFSLISLSAQESLVLRLAEIYLNNLLPSSLKRSFKSLFEQARKNLNGENLSLEKANTLEKEWLKKVRVVETTQPLLPPKIADGVFESVSKALYENKKLSIDYKNASGNRMCKTVLPLGLAQQGPRIYIVCRFEGFNDERTLALHRIVHAEIIEGVFERPKQFDLEKYDNDGRFGFGDGKKIKILFDVDKDAGMHLLETPLSRDQKVEDFDEYYRISATVVDSGQLQWWINSFGSSLSLINKLELPTE